MSSDKEGEAHRFVKQAMRVRDKPVSSMTLSMGNLNANLCRHFTERKGRGLAQELGEHGLWCAPHHFQMCLRHLKGRWT